MIYQKIFSILLILMLTTPLYASLLVDISADSNPGPLQAGYESFVGPANVSTTRAFDYSSSFAIANEVRVEISGNTHYRDYNAVQSSSPLAGLSALLSDNVLRNIDGVMRLKLINLQDGEYSITTYHHDTGSSGGKFDVRLTDANVTNQTLFSNVTTLATTNPSSLNTLTFNFEVSGGNAPIIFFERKVGSSGGNHLSLNGFDLNQLSVTNAINPVPEPATFVLALLAMGSLLVRKNNWRNQERW